MKKIISAAPSFPVLICQYLAMQGNDTVILNKHCNLLYTKYF